LAIRVNLRWRMSLDSGAKTATDKFRNKY